jgi:hypothetical protein
MCRCVCQPWRDRVPSCHCLTDHSCANNVTAFGATCHRKSDLKPRGPHVQANAMQCKRKQKMQNTHTLHACDEDSTFRLSSFLVSLLFIDDQDHHQHNHCHHQRSSYDHHHHHHRSSYDHHAIIIRPSYDHHQRSSSTIIINIINDHHTIIINDHHTIIIIIINDHHTIIIIIINGSSYDHYHHHQRIIIRSSYDHYHHHQPIIIRSLSS